MLYLSTITDEIYRLKNKVADAQVSDTREEREKKDGK